MRRTSKEKSNNRKKIYGTKLESLFAQIPEPKVKSGNLSFVDAYLVARSDIEGLEVETFDKKLQNNLKS